MLRITRQESGRDLILRLEGKLLEPWMDELFAALGTNGSIARTTLDLSELSFVDEAGAGLLRELRRRGARLVGYSTFLAEVMQLEEP